MAPARKRAQVNSSASHVFDVLRFVCSSPEPLGVTEISRRLSLPASTVFRALSTLEEADYIQRYQNTPRFELATMPHLLSRALFSRFQLHRASRHHLRSLAEIMGETVSLWVRLGWYVVRIAGAFGSHDIYHGAKRGETRLLHEGPAALVILGTLPTDQQAGYHAFLAREFPDRQPPDGWELIERELLQIAANGYASSPVPMAPGFAAAALPVRDGTGGAIASIMVDGPVLRSGDTTLDPRIIDTRNALETLILAEPERFRSPFAHIPPDNIRIQL